MKNKLMLAVLLSTYGTSALAGTGAINTYTTRHTRGHGKVDFVNVENYEVHAITNSQTLKMTAEGGDVNISNVVFDGKKLKGSAHSSNNVVVDPATVGSYTSSREVRKIDGVSKAKGYEQYDFTEEQYSHETKTYYAF